MKSITLNEAVNILTTDPTYRKDVYFNISPNCTKFHPGLLRVDRGQIYSKAIIYELGAAALFGGIYVED